MSYGIPSSDVLSISSGTQTIASGEVLLELNIRDRIGLTASSFTMDVLELGTIEYDFDFLEDVGNIDDFKITVPRFEFTARESITDTATSDSQSLIEIIRGLDNSDLIVMRLTFRGASDFYYCTREQVEFKFKDRTITFDMQHPFKFASLGYGEVYNNTVFTSNTTSFDTQTIGTIDALTPKNLVEGYLEAFGTTNGVVYESGLYPYGIGNIASQNATVFIFNEDVTTWDGANDFGYATGVVKDLALRDAAIVGTGFGRGFYVSRYSKNPSPAFFKGINVDDLEELEMDIKFKNIRRLDFFVNYTDNTANIEVSNYIVNEYGAYNATLTYNTAVTDLSAGTYDIASATVTFQNSLALPTESSNVVSAYKRVLRIADGAPNVDAGVAISGTILGIDKLNPWDYFIASSNIHPLVDGKYFRPSYLKFDLENDKIEFEAYEF